jgi:bifunctional non-homologous end joining protein LigD
VPHPNRSITLVASRKLSTYRAKRDFTRTAEPSGEHRVAPSRRLRFVIQKHAARRLHYDLRLELGGVFKSWAVTKGPSLDPADKRLAVEVEDHPLDYGDFEGTIPAGEYGGGTVQLWDRGYWEPLGDKTPEEALAKGDFKFVLFGKRLHGSWVLVRMRSDRDGGKRTNWLLIKHRDEYATAGHGEAVLEEDKSVASGRPMADIAAGKGKRPKPFMLDPKQATRADAVWHSNRSDGGGKTPPAPKKPRKPIRSRFVPPQLAKLVDSPPVGEDWVHEIKIDGYRLELQVADGGAALYTRTGPSRTPPLPSRIASSTARSPRSMATMRSASARSRMRLPPVMNPGWSTSPSIFCTRVRKTCVAGRSRNARSACERCSKPRACRRAPSSSTRSIFQVTVPRS